MWRMQWGHSCHTHKSDWYSAHIRQNSIRAWRQSLSSVPLCLHTFAGIYSWHYGTSVQRTNLNKLRCSGRWLAVFVRLCLTACRVRAFLEFLRSTAELLSACQLWRLSSTHCQWWIQLFPGFYVLLFTGSRTAASLAVTRDMFNVWMFVFLFLRQKVGTFGCSYKLQILNWKKLERNKCSNL